MHSLAAKADRVLSKTRVGQEVLTSRLLHKRVCCIPQRFRSIDTGLRLVVQLRGDMGDD